MAITIEDAKTVMKSHIITMKLMKTDDTKLMLEVFETIMNHVDRLEKDSYPKIMEMISDSKNKNKVSE
jgi:ADP-ribosylglycohydrolase